MAARAALGSPRRQRSIACPRIDRVSRVLESQTREIHRPSHVLDLPGRAPGAGRRATGSRRRDAARSGTTGRRLVCASELDPRARGRGGEASCDDGSECSASGCENLRFHIVVVRGEDPRAFCGFSPEEGEQPRLGRGDHRRRKRPNARAARPSQSVVASEKDKFAVPVASPPRGPRSPARVGERRRGIGRRPHRSRDRRGAILRKARAAPTCFRVTHCLSARQLRRPLARDGGRRERRLVVGSRAGISCGIVALGARVGERSSCLHRS